MEDCIFCKIIRGEIPCTKVYENESTFAFLDIRPNNPGHTLVIPKKHSDSLLEADEEDVQEIMKTVKMLAPKILEAVNSEGFNLIVNTNGVAGQVVFHTHFHIIPRFSDDGHRHWHGKETPLEEKEKVAEKIKKLI